MNYDIDQCYDFLLAPQDSPSDDYFNIIVPTLKGQTIHRLKKLPFQCSPGYKIPVSLSCRVKSLADDGSPVLTHFIGPYVYDLYLDKFQNDESFECEVFYVPASPAEEPFMLRDKNGIFFRLNEPEGLLEKRQIVRCKFTKLTERYFSLIRVDEGINMPFFSPDLIAESTGLPHVLKRFIFRNILSLPEMGGIKDEISAKQPRWVFNASKIILENLSEWLHFDMIKKHGHLYRRLLMSLRETMLFLLEGSNYLNSVHPDQRLHLQDVLTKRLESLNTYDKMIELVLSGEQDEFVEKIFDKLRKSGYLYHPSKQLAILMHIFHLQPDKVAGFLNRIFESIFGRDLSNWKREPFRRAFIEQFNIYVSQAKSEIDTFPQAESREQKTKIETVILAIALEILLSEESDGTDPTRIYSLFFRYISLLRPLNTEALLSKSFLTLLGVSPNMHLEYEQLREPMMMMTKATVLPTTDILSLVPGRHRYHGPQIDITISAEGIALRRTGESDVTEKTIPDGLMPWLKPQIYLNGIRGLSGSRLTRLSEHHTWWQAIENALMEQSAPSIITEEEIHKAPAAKGDEVYIVIDSVDDYNTSNPTFNCHIDDIYYLDGIGTLKRDMIVGFNLTRPSESVYRNSDGSQYGFLAKVLDIKADGSYIFSLRDEVDRVLQEKLSFDTEYYAVITGINANDYSAIARDGFGLFIEKDPEQEFEIGEIVKCRLSQKGNQGSIRAYITDVTESPEDKFDKSTAFSNIMKQIRVSTPETEEEKPDEEYMRDIDEILKIDDIREIVEILRFKAIAESDLIKAYDYLRFARLLSLAIGDNQASEILGTHASLLTHHQYFAKNNKIEAENLEMLRAESAGNPLLAQIFRRLELVSWLGRKERNAELYQIIGNPANELEGSIASMVLSYNLIHDSDDTIAANIQSKIMEKLNVNSETKPGKYYGSESKFLEFKTSLVYMAVATGEKMKENPEGQQFHILSRIAGMLNSGGGRLYLGVNNDGYEVGLHDDFKYYERHPRFKINNIDSLCVYIENIINAAFGRTTARKITVGADDEAKKGVVVIDVAESLDPVFIEGRLFVRQSGQSTREYHDEDIEDFVKEREALKAERINQTTDTPQEKTIVMSNATTNENTVQPSVTTPEEPEATVAEVPVIATSIWRPNVLHYYEPGYIEPKGYLYFKEGGKLLYSTNDLYMETGTDSCNLALAIPHELSSGFLIIAYPGEKALKIPLSEIYEKGENTPADYNSQKAPMFAALANKDDALICIVADSGGSLWRRGISVEHMENGHLTSTPRRIHEATVDHTVQWEIADSSAKVAIADCLAENLKSSRIGVTLRSKEGSENADSKIREVVNNCKTALI